jgi:hypothetical protein
VIDAKAVTFETASGSVSTPIADVAHVEFGNPAADKDAKYTEVELTDGTVFRCSQVKAKGESMELTVLPGRAVTVPVKAVYTMLRDAQDATNKQQWLNFLKERNAKRDYYVRKEDDGSLKGYDGTIGPGDETGESVEFEFAGAVKRPIKLSRVHGLVFRQQAGGEIAPTLCKVIDGHRNLLVAKSVTTRDKGLVVATVSGVVVEFPATAEVAKLDYIFGKQMFLSDLEPVAVEAEDNLGSAATYRRDRNFWGTDDQKLGGQVFTKGLAVHARTVLTYGLNGDYKEFKAVLGVDDSVTTESRVRITVEGDGREIFAAEVSRKDKPRPLTLDVKNVKQFRLTVESVGLLDLGNQLNLADAKVMK